MVISSQLGREAILQKPDQSGRIVCTACARYCRIGEGQIGLCGVRGVVDGKLRLFVYGRVITGHVDPIEKKPVTHYMPGSKIFSIATTGCNWLCHPAGTQILMSDGRKKNVEDLLPGDAVWSYDVEKDMGISPSIVTHVGARISRLWEVRYGSNGHGRLLLTEEHPLLTQTGWKPVNQLQPGDQILRVWYQNTVNWKKRRSVSISRVKFDCRRCGAEIVGLDDWNRHRGYCYARDIEKPIELLNMYSQRMRANNPMKNTDVARRALHTGSMRFLLEPSHGWHKNVERLGDWLHRHPSAAQAKLYEILDSLGVTYEKEYRIFVERKIPNAKFYYIADAAFPDIMLDIEVDGWWHFHNPKVAEQDRVRDEALRANGWEVLRLSDSYLFNHPEEVKALIAYRLAAPVMVNKRQWVTVRSVRPLERVEPVYSFECIPNHNYVADGVVVHNCAYCQNFDISQRRRVEGVEASPEQVVEMALRYKSDGIAYTYNEPSIFMEYAHDIGVIARRRGLINIFVTNGYWTPDAVSMAGEFLDCATVDFKGSGEREFVRRYIGIPDAEPIFQTILEMRDKTGIHIEITDLIVPTIGDNLDAARRLSRWVYENLGPETPIHFLRFHPDYKLMHLPWTPVETLEKHWEIARAEGLQYVYIGNVPGHRYENTYCHGCGVVVVERHGYDILDWRLDKDNRCMQCGCKIPIVGRPPRRKVDGRSRFIPVIWD